MEYTIRLDATVVIVQKVEASSEQEAETFAHAIIYGEAISDPLDLISAIDPESLELSGIYGIQSSQ